MIIRKINNQEYQFVSIETGMQAKLDGFNEPCIARYNPDSNFDDKVLYGSTVMVVYDLSQVPSEKLDSTAEVTNGTICLPHIDQYKEWINRGKVNKMDRK